MSEMAGGAVVSEVLKQLIKEAKKVKKFKPLSDDLASTIERLVPLTLEIESLQNQLNLDVGELKLLKETIEKAKIVVHKSGDVPWWKRSKLTREIEQVNKDMLKCCQIDIQLLLFRNRMQSMVGGAVVSEGLKQLIEEAKKFKNFKPLSEDLASTMERLVLLTEKIDLVQNHLNLDVEELKGLKETIERAKIVVHKCRDIPWWKRSKLTREIERINKDMLKCCQIDIQLLLIRNHMQSMVANNNMQLQSEANNNNFKKLCSVPKLKMVPVGLDLPLMELKKKLIDDSLDRLVVSAPPGCGKTTLVTHLCHDQDIKTKFNHIFYSVVSSTPNFRFIVHGLIEHNGYQPPSFANDTQAAIGLRTLLERFDGNDAILWVLDDVWSDGAESFLGNFPTDIPNLKILVTSRFDTLDFGYNFRLRTLGKEDAKTLLIQCASRPDQTSDAEYEHLLQEILERCNGFPLLIEVMGASLKNKSLTQWRGQVISWSKRGTVLYSVINRLLPSFDALDSNLKQCFLDMGLFPEDQEISSRIVTDIWAELYGNNGIITEKDKNILSMKYLEDLASHNLLHLVPLGKKEREDGSYNEYKVTQHDILRELAIRQNESEGILERKRLSLEIRNNRFPDWCLNPIHPVVINASLLSIFTDNAFSSPWFEMDFPNVEVLLLNISSANYELPSFIATMKKLKVVIIINHGPDPDPAKLTNLSCLSSLPKLKRIRLERVSITFLDILQLQLGSLKKLSLYACFFGEVSHDKIEIDVSKALSSLQEIDIDCCYDLEKLPNWICEAVSLERLSITSCHKLSILPEAIGNLSKLKLLRLCSCINLTELPETTARLNNLKFLDISHCLGLRKLPLEIGRLQRLKKIYMNKCWKCELPDSVRNLENLEVKCDEETKSILWEGLEEKMKNLTVEEEETEHNLNLLQMF